MENVRRIIREVKCLGQNAPEKVWSKFYDEEMFREIIFGMRKFSEEMAW